MDNYEGTLYSAKIGYVGSSLIPISTGIFDKRILGFGFLKEKLTGRSKEDAKGKLYFKKKWGKDGWKIKEN